MLFVYGKVIRVIRVGYYINRVGGGRDVSGLSSGFVIDMAAGVFVRAEDRESRCLSFVELKCNGIDIMFVYLGEVVRFVPLTKW